jgi:hypothetical protein
MKGRSVALKGDLERGEEIAWKSFCYPLSSSRLLCGERLTRGTDSQRAFDNI